MQRRFRNQQVLQFAPRAAICIADFAIGTFLGQALCSPPSPEAIRGSQCSVCWLGQPWEANNNGKSPIANKHEVYGEVALYNDRAICVML